MAHEATDPHTLSAPRLPVDFNLHDMSSLCTHDIPRSREDPRAEECCHWMGRVGSYNLIPGHMRNSVDTDRRVCGKLRYFVGGKQHSPRNLAFLSVRSADVPPVPIERFRLASLCKSTTCVNPWHHAVNPVRRKRISKRAEKHIHTPSNFMTHPLCISVTTAATIEEDSLYYPPRTRRLSNNVDYEGDS